jgi:hypothetical protein
MRSRFKHDAFMAHNWANDLLGRSNHSRTGRVAAELIARGANVWFDERELVGDLFEAMKNGIDNSACVLVFVTKLYMEKTMGLGEKGAQDSWCVRADRRGSRPPPLSPPRRATVASSAG